MTKNVAVASAVKQKITQNSVEILVFLKLLTNFTFLGLRLDKKCVIISR